jgi:hypothetical protein
MIAHRDGAHGSARRAKRNACRAAGILRREPATLELVLEHLEMRGELAGEIGLEA